MCNAKRMNYWYMMYLLVPGLACALPDPLAQKVYLSHDLRITQIYAIK